MEDWVPVQSRRAHVHHAIAGYCGRRSIVNIVWLKDKLAVRVHGDAISVGQCQRLVVIKYTVEVLDPQSIHWAIHH